MRILITGGTGFIAKNLVEQLSYTHEDKIISLGSKELNLLDTCKVFNFIKDNRFDVVIHTATWDIPKTSINCTKDPTKVLEYNLKMFYNVARCSDCFDKMIYFGSGAEFSREYWIPKMKEDYFDHYVPSDPYGFSKYVMTKYTYAKSQFDKKIYNLRIFGVFGKYEDWKYRFISNACARIVYDLPIIINQNVMFDYLYVDDLVKIVKWFIDRAITLKLPTKYNVYNISSGTVNSLENLAKKIIEISGKKHLQVIIKNEGLGKEYSADNSLFLNEINEFNDAKIKSPFTFTNIDHSIETLYNWYSENKHMINKDEI
ncbi:MAG: NAD(P)-dependent oxidoreductase [Oligoflexia bacterium]|nr:NAD(P)-dependent oxidoreductase [Oligoflexia bacterium]